MNSLGSYLHELRFDVDIDRTPIDIVRNLKPDLIIMNNNMKKIHMLDVKVPYDDYYLFMANRVDNSRKYRDFQIQLNTHKRHSLTMDTINNGFLGAWDPNNER